MSNFQRAGFAAPLLGLLAVSTAAHGVELSGAGRVWSAWSEPADLAAVNSTSNEQNAVLLRDGRTLYFTSNRPGGHGNLDLWVAERSSSDGIWGSPVNLPEPLNTPSNDLAPHLSLDGRLLFFASDREGGYGSFDIYVASRMPTAGDSQWSIPANVGSPINTPDWELAPFLLHGSLFFNRGDQRQQRADIYHAVVDHHGFGLGPIAPATELNSPFNDSAVTIRRDGREVFFWSQRTGTAGPTDIWTATRRSIHHPWSTPVNVGAPLSTEFSDVTPSLSFDGGTMIFGSDRPGGMGGNDLWMTTREPVRP
jgi:Tol biopolymer transport system component